MFGKAGWRWLGREVSGVWLCCLVGKTFVDLLRRAYNTVANHDLRVRQRVVSD